MCYHPVKKIRSSRPEVFCKKGVLKNVTKFTGKHLRQSLFINKVAGLSRATLLKKRIWHRCFPVNFVTFLREHLFYRTTLHLKNTENTVSHLYFNEESDYSEENTCGNEVFRSTKERN